MKKNENYKEKQITWKSYRKMMKGREKKKIKKMLRDKKRILRKRRKKKNCEEYE